MSKEKDVARPSDEEGEKLTRMMVIAPAHLVREHDIRTGAKKGRLFHRLPRDEDPTRTWAEQAVGEMTESEYKRALAERAGYELPVEEGVRPLQVTCKACGKIFEVPKTGWVPVRCKQCSAPKCSTPGCNKELNKDAMRPCKIRQRKGALPMCRRCQLSETLRKQASMTPGQRSEVSRKANAAMTPGQRSERMRKQQAAMTPEQHSERMRKSWETRRANAKKAKEEDE